MPPSPPSKSQESPPFTTAALSKIINLASLLDSDSGAPQQQADVYGQTRDPSTVAIQRISRAVIWGLRSSLGITPGNGTLELHLEGRIIYTKHAHDGDTEDFHVHGNRWDRGGPQYDGSRKEISPVYKGDTFHLGNMKLDLEPDIPSVNMSTLQQPAVGVGVNVPQYSDLNSQTIHNNPGGAYSLHQNVNFPNLPHQNLHNVHGTGLHGMDLIGGSHQHHNHHQQVHHQGQAHYHPPNLIHSHSQIQHHANQRQPDVELRQTISNLPHEVDYGRKRSRDNISSAVDADEDDETDSDHLAEEELPESNDVDIQRLQLQSMSSPTGMLPTQQAGYMINVHSTSSVSPSSHDHSMGSIHCYQPKIQKIGTSRPRKKQSPGSGLQSPGTDTGSNEGIGGRVSKSTKKRSGMSLVERVWHGIFEGTKFSKQFNGDIGVDAAKTVNLQLRILRSNTPVTQKLFQEINTNCSALYASTGSFRILDLIMQAIWVDIFHLRVTHLAIEPNNQFNSPTDNNILALKESRSVFGCSEKEMRNKLAIWSGYKKIKDIGGWPALIFAEEGGGVYNVCKYRGGGWKDGVFEELEKLRSAMEVAADTLQPEWRRLLEVLFGDDVPGWHGGIGQRPIWHATHPHAWVIDLDGRPLSLSDTYRGGLEYLLIDESVVDEEAWPDGDPRRRITSSSNPSTNNASSDENSRIGVMDTGMETYICDECGDVQSPDVLGNKCLCYPDLYGGGTTPFGASSTNHSYTAPPPHHHHLLGVSARPRGRYTPVQVIRTASKGNGLIARLPLPAGRAIGEFAGLVTKGLIGVDVMEGGTAPHKYQISQVKIGNFTRFINHSCNPNARFVRFVWLGIERIVIVSKENGIEAGKEITVDYSNGYWDGLNKVCKCGEKDCRYPRKQT